MAINLRLSSSASGTRNIGPVNMGGGSNMLERSLFASSAPTLPYSQWYVPGNGSPAISASDYYLMNGIYWSKPYDLDTMGTDGATIKAREGMRYVWMMGPDHPFVTNNFLGSSDFFVGYSNDPQVWPDPSTIRSLRAGFSAINVVDQNGTTQNNFLIYHTPYLVYNADGPSAAAIAAGVPSGDKFFIYAEGTSTSSGLAHELSLMTTADLLSATLIGPTIPTTNVNGTTSFGQPVRLGVNSWEVFSFGKPDATTSYTIYKYTSTDGWIWTSTFSAVADNFGPFMTIAGTASVVSGERGSSDYLSYWAVNSNKQRTSGATRISTAFQSDQTEISWQTLLQDVQAYVEDGVASIYITRGYFPSAHDRTNPGPYLGNTPALYTIVGSVTSNVLDVTTWPAGNPPLAVGFKVDPSININSPTITSLGTGTGGLGTYNLSSTSNKSAGTTFTVVTNGGLWQQMVDQYYLITDATAAASAAPLGVKASCTSGLVTIQWNNSLPHQNYRVYRGTTAGTQATLIGDVTGTSITDTPTPGSQYFYKVVTMNSGEQKSRVVSVYASNNTLMVNKHVNRFLNAGGNISNINISFVATADAWLTSNDAWRYVNWWVDVRFGYLLDGSSFISKIFCLGTTYLPRGGDYTPTTSNTFPSTTSNTSYSATSFRGTTPSWINNASSAHGYFGNGRSNNIQRWNEITLLAAYQKPGTSNASLFGLGQFGGMYLLQNSGASGTVDFGMSAKIGGGSSYTVATVAFSGATTARVAAGVLDSSGNMTAYLDGTPGTPASTSFANPLLLNESVLRGAYTTSSTPPVLASGSSVGLKPGTYTLANESLFTGAGLAVFNKGLSQSLIQSWGAMYA